MSSESASETTTKLPRSVWCDVVAKCIVKEIAIPFDSTATCVLLEKNLSDIVEELKKEVLLLSVQCASKLIKGIEVSATSSARSILNQLGTWIGSITLARNRVLRANMLNLKDTLVEGYQQGRLHAILPFVCQVLLVVKGSIFAPPNPWTVGILYILFEFSKREGLAAGLRYEIELLTQRLEVPTMEVPQPKSEALQGLLGRHVMRAPDYHSGVARRPRLSVGLSHMGVNDDWCLPVPSPMIRVYSSEGYESAGAESVTSTDAAVTHAAEQAVADVVSAANKLDDQAPLQKKRKSKGYAKEDLRSWAISGYELFKRLGDEYIVSMRSDGSLNVQRKDDLNQWTPPEEGTLDMLIARFPLTASVAGERRESEKDRSETTPETKSLSGDI